MWKRLKNLWRLSGDYTFENGSLLIPPDDIEKGRVKIITTRREWIPKSMDFVFKKHNPATIVSLEDPLKDFDVHSTK